MTLCYILAGSNNVLRSIISLVSRKWSIFDELQISCLQIINNRPFSTDYNHNTILIHVRVTIPLQEMKWLAESRSRGTDTVLWLAESRSRGTDAVLWLVESSHVTCIQCCDWFNQAIINPRRGCASLKYTIMYIITIFLNTHIILYFF